MVNYLTVKNGFYSFLKSKSIEFEVVLKVKEDSNRIELESKNSDDSIRWRIRSGLRDLKELGSCTLEVLDYIL